MRYPGTDPAVDYDALAPTYDRRYDQNQVDGIHARLRNFLTDTSSPDVAEVGCGTGYWLAAIHSHAASVAGVDASWGMLASARASAPHAHLVHGRAEQLPWRAAVFDRVFCVNALHHFRDVATFVGEVRRVLRPGGALLSIGLDPHTGRDQWWIYDYFPDALLADRARYAPTAVIRSVFRDAGFVRVTTDIAQHIPAALPFDSAAERGVMDRSSTSQLMVISDAHWEAGLARLNAERPVLRADLRLFATVGWLVSISPMTEKRLRK